MQSTTPLTVNSALGSVSKTGHWQVPAQINATSTMGSLLLDFSEADCPHTEVTLAVNCQAGRITVVVPAGWGVDTTSLDARGAGVESTASSAREPGLPLLRITGQVTWGRLIITDPEGHQALRDERTEQRQHRHERHEQRRTERALRHDRHHDQRSG